MKLLQMNIKIQQNNKEYIDTYTNNKLNINHKNVINIDPFHLEKIYQHYFVQFKKQLIDLIDFYSEQYICLTSTSDNQTDR